MVSPLNIPISFTFPLLHLYFSNIEGTCDPYCVVKADIGNEEFRTVTAYNTCNPFWAEEFIFEDLDPTFQSLSLVVWNDNNQCRDLPLGKIILSRRILNGEIEKWYPLSSANNEGTGRHLNDH